MAPFSEVTVLILVVTWGASSTFIIFTRVQNGSLSLDPSWTVLKKNVKNVIFGQKLTSVVVFWKSAHGRFTFLPIFHLYPWENDEIWMVSHRVALQDVRHHESDLPVPCVALRVDGEPWCCWWSRALWKPFKQWIWLLDDLQVYLVGSAFFDTNNC